MKDKRLAAIDIGTNSIRSIVVQADRNGKFKILDDEKVTVRLGAGLNQSGSISLDARQRAMEALSRFKKIIDGFGVVAIEAVATSAVRKATNGNDFIQAIKNEIGLQVNLISGEEEAELAAMSAFNNFDLEETRHLMIDIGGGSLELVLAVGNLIEEIHSLELGAVYLTETFFTQDPVTVQEQQHLRRHIRKTLKNAFADERFAIPVLVGSGGTITAIASMVMAARKEGYESLHGYEVMRSEIVHLLAMLQRKSLKERKLIPGLNSDRADIIVAGVTVVDELMDFFNGNLLKINERGIREGLILKGLRTHNLLTVEESNRSWRSSVLEFAASCHFDEQHSFQVAKLALIIAKELSGPFKLREKDLRLLEAATILHDVGYFINYSAHHKHSYHLIRHADLFGFNPRERELIANIARYHRKSLPKKKHEPYIRLSEEDRLLVARLSGILRLADGLDRRRNSLVESLECYLTPAKFVIRLHGPEDISVEIFGGKIKGDLFQEAFQLKLILESSTSPAPVD